MSKLNTKGKVFVGVSGGVDSSVAAALLKERGYEVTGVFIKTWQPPFLACTQQYDRRDAMRVCAKLGIPFLLCDAEEAYKKGVVDYMVAEYARGRTPNPDIFCNKYVKFGAFYDFAMSRGADFVATGHYARAEAGKLFAAVDPTKDQSYFLSQVPSEVLAKSLFPIGEYEKAKVRGMAERFGLFTAGKKDSQGLCFMGKLDFKEFLKEMIPGIIPGDVLDSEGKVVGSHDGAALYTLGERHGLRLHVRTPEQAKLYVIAKDIERNTLTIGEKPQALVSSRRITLEGVTILNKDIWRDGAVLEMQYRYHGQKMEVKIEGTSLLAQACPSDVSLGQLAVLFSGDECIGSGILGGLTKTA